MGCFGEQRISLVIVERIGFPKQRGNGSSLLFPPRGNRPSNPEEAMPEENIIDTDVRRSRPYSRNEGIL
jgi:hypothetical protein